LIYTDVVAARVSAVHGARCRATVTFVGVISVIASLTTDFQAVSTDCSAASLSAGRVGAVPSGLLGAGAAAAIVTGRVLVVAGLVAGQLAVSAGCITALWSFAITCESTLHGALSCASITSSSVVIIARFVANLLAIAAHPAAR